MERDAAAVLQERDHRAGRGVVLLVSHAVWRRGRKDHALKQAGVDIRVCDQGLLSRKIDPKQVNPDVQIDLWAMTTLVNLQLKGYVRVG